MGCSDSRVESRKAGSPPVSPKTETADVEIAMPHYEIEEKLEGIRRRPSVKVQNYRVLLTGLEGAGKTHLLYTLINEKAAEPCETEDYREETMYVTLKNRTNFLLVDLGGREDVRKQYLSTAFKGCSAIIFCVDMADTPKIEDAADWLNEVLSSPHATSSNGAPLPLLILGTKSDLSNSRSAMTALKERVTSIRDHNKDRVILTATSSIQSTSGHTAAATGLRDLAMEIKKQVSP
eukprot:TRINITY_DN3207_c0_g1_i2.p1 TRINITY_DN3207_c0_g1~~TRINITY_DN3207_c0_g1_i2.p1  ORF type:complete len:270 (+),score=39.09 TRINITY_DN3207_c0_g1_i2:106-810(+)